METTEIVKVAVLEEQMKTLAKGLETLGTKIDTLSEKIDNNYVKQKDFDPVKTTVESLKLWQAKVVGIAIAVAFIVDYIVRILFKTN